MHEELHNFERNQVWTLVEKPDNNRKIIGTKWVLSAFWERGSPELPACGPWHGFAGRPVRPIFINKESRPSRGGRHKTSSGAASPGCLVRGGEFKAGQTS